MNIENNFTNILSNRDQFMKTLFERGESFSKLLPYQEYHADSGIHLLKDGSLGAVFEIELLEHEPIEALYIIESVENLKSWFQLPESCTLQVLFDQSYIPKRDKIWNHVHPEFSSGHSISQEIHNERMVLFKSMCETEKSISPMRRKSFLSIRFFPKSLNENSMLKNIFSLNERSEQQLFNSMTVMKEDLSEFQQILAQFQESSKIKLHRISGEELTEYLRRFFNPKEYLNRDFAKYNPNLSISDQIIYTDQKGSYSSLERENLKSRTITLKTNPSRLYSGGVANFLNIKFPFKISVSFSFPSKSKIKSYFDFKEFFLQNTPSARAKRQQTELKQIQERLAHDERCVFMTYSVIVEGETEEILNQRIRSIASIFNNDLECEVIKEEKIGFALCLNSLPLFYSPASDLSAQRFIRTMTKDAAKLLPIFDSFRGMKIPMQHFLSRENNLVPFSWANNEICNHMAILGDTGSGKSKFALDCVQAYKRKSPEPLVFVIDKRASCKSLCDQYNGELITFDPHKTAPFSAFRGVFNDQKVQFLVQLILTGIKLTSPSFTHDSKHITILTRAIKEAYIKRANNAGRVFVNDQIQDDPENIEVRVSMDDVVSALAHLPSMTEFESYIKEVEELNKLIEPFWGDNIYAPFFRAPEKAMVNSKCNLYAYDLEALDVDPILKVLMSMCVINEILTIMNESENLKRGGILYIEELGCLGRDNPIVGQFIQEAAERMRKLGFWLIGVAPVPKIYFETEAGKAIWQAAQHYCFLNMGSDNAKYLKDHSDLLKPTDLEIIGTLRTIPNEYAEVYYVNKNGNMKGAFRYIQSSKDRMTSINSFKDITDIENMTEGVLK